MAGQIHGVMQQTEHIDRGRLSLGPDTIQHKMAALATLPSDVKHPDSLTDAAAFPGSDRVRTIRKRLDGGGQGIACISHHPTVEAHDTTARTSLRLLAVLNVLFKYACARQAARASS